MTQRIPRTDSELADLIRSVDVPAPQSLHESVQALIDERSRERARRGLRLAAPLLARPRLSAAAALGVVAVVLALVLSGGGSSSHGPNLRQAVALTLASPTRSAPAESAPNSGTLAAAVDGVAFPYWEERLGWRTTGARSDRLGGRAVTTVFYADRAGRRVGYAIVSGVSPLPAGGTSAVRDGVRYRLAREDGAPAITWLREGRLCIISGRGLSAPTLLRLASWRPRAAAAA